MLGLAPAGCATPQRTSRNDAAIRSVAVLAVVGDDVPLRGLGLTIFNNRNGMLSTAGELGRLARETVESRLSQARPGWTLRPAAADTQALSAKLRGVWNSWGSKDRPLRDDLPAIARRAGVDALLVVEESRGEHGSGVQVVVRSLPGVQPRVRLQFNVVVYLATADGEVLSRRGLLDGRYVAASELGLADPVAAASQPAAADGLRAALRQDFRRSLLDALERLGY